ncbi:MAG TPA: hypothetical protein VK956_21125, partial [Verrucomicrobium sp.]|nr:hypothetical protein [Verrucomicrobium sp.]
MSGSPSASHSLQQSRLALAEARKSSAALRAGIAASGAELKELERSLPAQDPRLVTARHEQEKRRLALEAAQKKERAAQAAVDRDLHGVLTDSVAKDVASLGADYPFVLLPVRLETRFGFSPAGAPLLKVRIFPDELMADTHEPPLTVKEREAGVAYWRQGWDPAQERSAWRALIAQFPSPRAAWIARILTPSNLSNRPGGEPVFPQTEERSQSWTRPAEARVLPDRWLVTAFRSRRAVQQVTSLPVKEPLALTLSPVVEENDGNLTGISPDGLRIDDDIAWTVDFDRAVEVGMAVTMPLTTAILSRGIERLIVVGVKSSLQPEEASKRLAELLESHHYGRGLAFVPQGTPTNNTIDAPSGYPVVDPDGSLSFEVERSGPLTGPESNGTHFAEALGLPEEISAHLAGSGDREQPRARAMNEALWPATWNYFLDQLMDPVATDDAVRLAQGHYSAHVRGRGPLPAFRTGATPYGLLPVTSLNRWQPSASGTPVEAHLTPLLQTLRGIWQQQVSKVPRVGATGNPDDDMLAVLGMDASTREARVRRVLGPQFQLQLFATVNMVATNWQARLATLAQSVMSQIGHPDWKPRLNSMSFSDSAHLVGGPFVAPPPLSETEGLSDFNYIHWIRTASLAELRQEQLPPGVTKPAALFYHLLRHAALSLYSDTGTKVAIKHNLATKADQKEVELIGLAANTPPRKTVWERLDTRIPNVTGDATLGDFLVKDRSSEESKDIRTFHAALAELEKLPTAELDRLFTETLDTCSHRLDAWITSLPSKRLGEMRQRHRHGSHLAAFGWLENLQPDSTRPSTEPVDLGGFIHAPSASHAATAAILRNAHLTRAGEDRARYAVDLSSSRVRDASSLLEAVRQGQPLGAVLGYRFERGLHEGHRPLRLDKYIDPFRREYPLVADKGGSSGEPVEAIAARNVVDGLLLRAAWQKGEIAWGQRGLPAGGNDRAAAEAELRKLDEAVDGVADLLTAESVFQIVRGNSGRAAGVLDSLAQGLRPPEPEVAIQPRAGTTLTHRVALVLGGEPTGAADWSAIPATPRAVVEPYLDHWAGSLLGNPSQVQCRVTYVDNSNQAVHRIITLQDLGLRPIDVLALADGLDGFIASILPADASGVEIVYAADPAWDRATVRTFPDILEVARSLNALLTQCRALEPKDLVPPELAQSADAADRLEAEAAQRAGQALAALDDTISQIQSNPGVLRPALLLGVPESSGTVLAELLRRREVATAATISLEKVRAVFGRDFLFLPRFRGVNAAELDLALAHGPALVRHPHAVVCRYQQVARVRAPLASWRQLSLLTTALSRPPAPWDV